MLVNPLFGRFTFHIFGDENQLTIFGAGIENFGDTIVIEFPPHLCAFFKSNPLAFAHTRQRNELHCNRSPAWLNNPAGLWLRARTAAISGSSSGGTSVLSRS